MERDEWAQFVEVGALADIAVWLLVWEPGGCPIDGWWVHLRVWLMHLAKA